MERRNFIRSLAGITGSLSLAPFWSYGNAAALETSLNRVLAASPSAAASDEEFWAQIRAAYTVKGNEHINLNNGAVSPQPRAVEQILFEHTSYLNAGPSFYMRRLEKSQFQKAREGLAALLHCAPEEIALLRNTTEALENVIFGLPLNKGDEAIIADLDYPAMKASFEQRAARDGIVVKTVVLPLGSPTKADYLSLYEAAITSKTKVMLITHVIHHTGQILPVKELVELAHSKGVEVIVDGAHSVGQMDVDVKALNCDYFGSSLHKWICAPYGTGVLYMKQNKIAKVWPLFGADSDPNSIKKFEHIGTRNVPAVASINVALEFHHSIGIKRKQARLLYLKSYWVQQIEKIPKVKFSVSPDQTACFAHFSVEGKDMNKLFNRLHNKHNVYTMNYKYEERMNGIRVSPNLFTSLEELDLFCELTAKILAEL